jgi:hypothetical protein
LSDARPACAAASSTPRPQSPPVLPRARRRACHFSNLHRRRGPLPILSPLRPSAVALSLSLSLFSSPPSAAARLRIFLHSRPPDASSRARREHLARPPPRPPEGTSAAARRRSASRCVLCRGQPFVASAILASNRGEKLHLVAV